MSGDVSNQRQNPRNLKWRAHTTFDKALLPDMEDWDGENDICSIGGEVILSDLGAFTFIEEVTKKLDELYEIRILRIMDSYRFL